jgi:glyoxylase-like metal-dependent hydrolase (beta-lactamase superfamily II)
VWISGRPAQTKEAAAAALRGNTGTVVTFSLGNVVLTRVPYFDVALDADVIGFSPQQLLEVPWGIPDWTTSEGRVIVGQAIWVIESDDQTVVVDPCGAADTFLRSGPEASTHEAAAVGAMASAGFPVNSVDLVVMSHLDGIGMVGSLDAEGHCSPLFPNARIVVSERERAHIEANKEIGGRSAFRELEAQGVVDAVRCPYEIAPHVTMEQTGGHSPGHCALRVGDEAVLIGHLAINPVQVSAGIMPTQHLEPILAFTALEQELAWARERNALIIGSLWPEPGAGKVVGPPWVISPAV